MTHVEKSQRLCDVIACLLPTWTTDRTGESPKCECDAQREVFGLRENKDELPMHRIVVMCFSHLDTSAGDEDST